MPLEAACEIKMCKSVIMTWILEFDKGFAFVTMENEEGVESAISKLNGAEIDGQEVKVELAKPRYYEWLSINDLKLLFS